MQALASISTALIYLVLSIGINLNLHYCENKIKDVHLEFRAQNNILNYCHQEGQTDCCVTHQENKEEECTDCCTFIHKIYRLKDEQNTDYKKSFLSPLYQELQEFKRFVPKEIFIQPLVLFQIPAGKSVYLLNCAFIYYG